jgi:hypothetical protein
MDTLEWKVEELRKDVDMLLEDVEHMLSELP